MKILLLTHLFPNAPQPIKGSFNLSRFKALRALGCKVIVIAPISLTPPERCLFPFPKLFEIWNFFKCQISIAKYERIEGFEVYHPKWAGLPRRWFWRFEVDLLYLFAGGTIFKIINNYSPDVVITSWLHPYGTFTKYIKKYYKIPVFVIAEGSDILNFPQKYHGWKKVKDILNRFCDKLILVSNKMEEKVKKDFESHFCAVIKNGYDKDLFYFKNIKPNKKK